MDRHFMSMALKEAEEAFQLGEVPVGAVLVHDHRVIAAAHNARETAMDPTAHAEMVAIREGAAHLGNWRLADAVLYVTKEPCVMCAGAMINARLGRLVYGCKDGRYGAVTSGFQLLFDSRQNHQVRVRGGILEGECAEILRRFFVQLRGASEGSPF